MKIHRLESGPASRLTLDRLNSLTDGIMAFAMTLLVLNVEIPHGHDFSKDGFVQFLIRTEHDFVLYAANFFLIATYWAEHHQIFHFIRYLNRSVVWLNLIFLFAVTVLPFATKLKNAYDDDIQVVFILAGVHLACWFSLLALWQAEMAAPALHCAPIPLEIRQKLSRRLLIGPIIILAAVGLSCINTRLGVWAFLSVPLVFLAIPPISLDLENEPGP